MSNGEMLCERNRGRSLDGPINRVYHRPERSEFRLPVDRDIRTEKTVVFIHHDLVAFAGVLL